MLHKSLTYSLRDEREIRQLLNDYFHIRDLLAYAHDLHDHFFLACFGASEDSPEPQPNVPAIDIYRNMQKASVCFAFYVETEQWADMVVEEELNFPTTIEYRDTVSTDCALRIFLSRFTSRWLDSLHVEKIMQYREETDDTLGPSACPGRSKMFDFFSTHVGKEETI